MSIDLQLEEVKHLKHICDTLSMRFVLKEPCTAEQRGQTLISLPHTAVLCGACNFSKAFTEDSLYSKRC